MLGVLCEFCASGPCSTSRSPQAQPSSHAARGKARTYSAITSLRAAVPGVVSGRNLAVAGRIPWEKLLLTKAQARQIVKIMRAETVSICCTLLALSSRASLI